MSLFHKNIVLYHYIIFVHSLDSRIGRLPFGSQDLININFISSILRKIFLNFSYFSRHKPRLFRKFWRPWFLLTFTTRCNLHLSWSHAWFSLAWLLMKCTYFDLHLLQNMARGCLVRGIDKTEKCFWDAYILSKILNKFRKSVKSQPKNEGSR